MEVGIIILAGGKSSRMGEDKGLMPLFGKPMIQYVIEVAKQISNEIIIVSSNSNYKKFGYAVVKDKYKEKGPLAGIYSGLTMSKYDYNLVLSCDIPYIKAGLIKFIIYQAEGFDITVANHNDRIHPLIGVYRKSCSSPFKNRINLDALKIIDAFKDLNVNIIETVEFDDIEFKNVNSKNDIQ